MATPKRARATSTTTRTKKTAPPTALEASSRPQSQRVPEELIRFRAYQLFEQRGRYHGSDMEDWLRAEVEITTGKSQSA